MFQSSQERKIPPSTQQRVRMVSLKKGGNWSWLSDYFEQRTPEARDLDRDRGVFEIAFDPGSRINATFVSLKFNPVGSERWESKGEHLTLRS